MTTVVAIYENETVVRGERAHSGLMFWNAIQVEDSVDMDRLVARLDEIQKAHGVRYEVSGRRVNLPPAYLVILDPSLPGLQVGDGPNVPWPTTA